MITPAAPPNQPSGGGGGVTTSSYYDNTRDREAKELRERILIDDSEIISIVEICLKTTIF